jgi:uridine kinase
MQDKIKVTLDDGRVLECEYGTPVGKLIPSPKDSHGLHYLGALVNNAVVTLEFLLEIDSQVKFLTLADPNGWRIYRTTASFLLAKAVKELFPEANFSVEHSLGTGFYCYFESTENGTAGITVDQLQSIDAHLKDLVRRDLPIERRKVAFQDAVDIFQSRKQMDKYNLLRFRNPPKVVVYACDGFTDLSHGPLACTTGAITHFDLIYYPPGFVIQFPDRAVPPRIPQLRKQPQLFTIFQEHKNWGRILGVTTVGRLNEIVANKEIVDFIRISEAFHEKKIARVADQIAERREQIKWILIAGPSSSGKTTFAKRLAIQLRVNGLRPVTVSVDNYFVDREHTPKDSKGNYDFEHIDAIDLALFNKHLNELDRGNEVAIPRFNFEKGMQEFKGDKMKLEHDQLVILEGIHCLNPRLTQVLPPERKFKIYISALTQLNLDSNNRISTTDNRLVRRMVRDYQFRGHDALTTMSMWPNVRRGEKTWIFPFQKEADIAFNSALDYELSVLKPLVDPLLAEVKPHHVQYAEARRLQEFMESFLVIPPDFVPPTSILREFIGKSGFRY